MRVLLASLKALLIALSALIVTVLQLSYFTLFFWSDNKKIWFFPSLFHKTACKIVGIKVEFEGEDFGKIHKNKPLLYASNHTSYLDIVVIGSWVKGMFVAKSDIASWPIFGFLAKLQGTIFVERRPSAAKKQKEELENYVAKGSHLVIFPEGTTSLGTDVLPFKSSLFGAFMGENTDKDVYIQPISLTYTHMDGTPLDDERREIIAWYREDESMIPHLWRFLRHGKMKAKLTFSDPIKIENNADRKELAQISWQAVQMTNANSIKQSQS
ncbi:MAG: 1-acyl-sn-glycerol-3-phosphate acyltransferase [Rickettsiales bacterium]|nr:1-acyl-sn-glycerol-3-phosphate acyltransferase [Rickettsiales bacterium]|tara:strand:+ start:1069 stop:1875 length:807 start_codon:yes stop_codon:yes gene_type:complete